MTPKEKAYEIYNIFDMIIYTDQDQHDQTKRCSIRCVEQMILSHELWSTEQDEYIQYLLLVKVELEALR
jgi:hypothetical protein